MPDQPLPPQLNTPSPATPPAGPTPAAPRAAQLDKPQPEHQHELLAIAAEEITKSFMIGNKSYPVLHGISAKIYNGDFVIVYGPSGSGKSTMLNLLLGLEQPTTGKLWVAGQRIDHMDEDQRARMRAHRFGVVYQQPIWIKALTVLENVAMPLLISDIPEDVSFRKAKEALAEVGMAEYASYHPTEISGGQQQRVSLARSLVHNPKIMVLDEPTGNLDTHSADNVMQLLQNLNRDHRRTIIMVTHNMIYLPYANHTIMIQDGVINKDERTDPLTAASAKPAGPPIPPAPPATGTAAGTMAPTGPTKPTNQ